MARPKQSQIASIYGLFDKDGQLRYIGKAVDPQSRLKGHMQDARTKKTPLYDWIRKHGVPVMEVLEADCADWKEAERRLISEARLRGEDLLNVADGGDQPFCDYETRAENGRNNAKSRHKRLWYLKLQLGGALRRGEVREETKQMMRERPDIFGQFSRFL